MRRLSLLALLVLTTGLPATATAAITLSGPSPVATPSLSWTDATAGQGYILLRSAAGCATGDATVSRIVPSPFTPPLVDAGVADGLWCYVVVGQTDAAVSNALAVRVDTTPPTVSLDAPAAGFVRGTAALAATAADGGAGVTGVLFDAAGTIVAGAAAGAAFAATWDTTALPDGPASVTVTATDGVGLTATSSVAVTVDNTAPGGTVVAPATGATLTGDVTLAATVDDAGSGVLSGRFEVAGADGRWLPAGSPAAPIAGTVSVAWPSTAVADGTYAARLVVTDAVGNVTTAAGPGGIVVRNVPPAPPGVVVGSPTYTATATVLAWSPSTSPVDGYRIYRDGDATAIATVHDGTTYTDGTPLAEGAHAYRIVAFDAVLASAPSSAIPVFVDRSAPAAPASLAATVPAGTRDVTLAWGAADDQGGSGVVGYVVRRDGAPLESLGADAAAYRDTHTADATAYVYTVTAIDRAGNASAAARADITAPDITPPPVIRGFHRRVRGQDVAFGWQAPTDRDTVSVVVVQGTSAAIALPTDGRVVYRGNGTTATVRQAIGARRWYAVLALDRAGNVTATATLTVAVPASALVPVDGSVVGAAPRLGWRRVARATYYNVQVWSGQRKVLDTWSDTTSLTVGRTTLRRGSTYRWYVWPGLGDRAAARYGSLIGSARFTYAG